MKHRDETDKLVFQQGPWKIHEINMEYANGQISLKHYLEWPNSVMIFAIENKEIILIREFCRAMNRYEIFVPKGKINSGETPELAAQRELQEEANVKSAKLTKLNTLSAYPNHLQGETTIFLAQDLIGSKLPHDDSEEIEIIRIPVKEMTNMIESGKITEARTIAGWFLIQNFLQNHENH